MFYRVLWKPTKFRWIVDAIVSIPPGFDLVASGLTESGRASLRQFDFVGLYWVFTGFSSGKVRAIKGDRETREKETERDRKDGEGAEGGGGRTADAFLVGFSEIFYWSLAFCCVSMAPVSACGHGKASCALALFLEHGLYFTADSIRKHVRHVTEFPPGSVSFVIRAQSHGGQQRKAMARR